MRAKGVLAMIPFVALLGCATAAQHSETMPQAQERKTTVGVVQKEIRVGMTQTQVAGVLGSPNIVTSDGPGKENWVYDKMSTETAYSTSSGGVSALVVGGGPAAVGGVGGNYSAASGASSRTQRTLTVIIKFAEGKVYDFSYHASSF